VVDPIHYLSVDLSLRVVSRPSQRSVAPGGSLRFESNVSEVCGTLIGFRAALMQLERWWEMYCRPLWSCSWRRTFPLLASTEEPA